MLKREYYMEKIRPFFNTDLVKVLTGIRRCGKSVMLNQIKQELIEQGVKEIQCLTYNFESLGNAHLCTAQALYNEIISKAKSSNEKIYLFFDEIQEVAAWEKCINSLRVDLDCDIYITGSNAKLLSSELSTYLGGRFVEFTIYPFSFAEFNSLYTRVFPTADIRQTFNAYLTTGGMPYLVNLQYNQEPSRQYLDDLYNSVVLKDIVKRNKIRDIDQLERIIAYIMANIGNTFSANSVAKFFKSEGHSVAAETILNYIKYCTEAYLFYCVKRQDLQGSKSLRLMKNTTWLTTAYAKLYLAAICVI